MILKLPIFFHTEETSSLEDMGLESSVNSCEVENVIFYHIDAIHAFKEKDKTTIISSGQTFICNLPVEEVEKLIEPFYHF